MLNQVERYMLARPEQYVGSVMQTVGNFLVRNGLTLEVTGLVREMRSYGVFVVVNGQKASNVKMAVDELLLHYNDKKYRIDLCCDNDQSQDMCDAFQAMFDDETVTAGGTIEEPIEKPKQKKQCDLKQTVEEPPEAEEEVFGMSAQEAQELNKLAMNL